MPVGEGLDLRPDHHRAVVIGELADDGDRRQARELAEVDRRLGMARAHQDAAILGDRAERRGRGGRNRWRPMLRLASERTVLQRCSAEMPVVRPWRTSTETVKAVPSGASLIATIGGRCSRARLVGGQRRADDAAAIADDERHFLGACKRGGDDHVAFVLAIVVVGDDDDLAAGESLDGVERPDSSMSSPLCAGGARSRKSFGVTAPIVSATIRSAVSRESQAPCSRQISVTAPGDKPIRRAKSARVTPIPLKPVAKLHGC